MALHKKKCASPSSCSSDGQTISGPTSEGANEGLYKSWGPKCRRSPQRWSGSGSTQQAVAGGPGQEATGTRGWSG